LCICQRAIGRGEIEKRREAAYDEVMSGGLG
jgi:hypothetical protein